MDDSPLSLEPKDLTGLMAAGRSPVILDVRKLEAYEASDVVIATAVWRDPISAHEWSDTLNDSRGVVVYCIHGHQISQSVAALLRANGLPARYLTRGIEGFVEAGGPTVARKSLPERDPDGRTRWVTRARPKIDRIACPWFVRRFLDPDAVFLYVEAEHVHAVADVTGAIPFDVDDAELTHKGDRCSFDAFLERFSISNPAIDALAEIVRGADTGRPELTPESASLVAVSRGLAALYADDIDMLDAGMAVYDALYAECRQRAGVEIGAGG